MDMLSADTNSKLTDEELVAATLDDKQNLVFLIERYEVVLRRYIKRKAQLSEEDADDVLQDIFVKTYMNLNGFDKRLSFSSWIYRITHNEVISWWRKRKVRPEGNSIFVEDEILGNVAGSENVQKELEELDLGRIATAELYTLPEKYKDILILRFMEEKDYGEISDILKIPPGTVATRINRAKKKLKQQLEAKKIDV